MERDLPVEVAHDPMVSGVGVGAEVSVDPEIESRINAGYQRLVERMVTIGAHYGEFFPNGFSFSPDPDQLARVRTALDTAFGTLTERETRVLVLRNGLDGETPKRLLDVGKVLGTDTISGERVRQIEAKAMRKLRHPSRGLGVVFAEILGKDRAF